MLENFKSSGIKPSSILHINVAINYQPKKPVSVAMPIPYGLNQGEDVKIFKSDHGDNFTDVTDTTSVQVSECYVLLRVKHFTKYVDL